MANQGRKKLGVNWEEVDSYLQAGCTGTAIAEILGMNADTLYKRCEEDHKMVFSAYAQQKKAKGISLVRKTLYDKAINDKDNTCLIFLAKTDGGMKETQVNENINEKPLEVIVKLTKDDITSDSIE